MLKSFKYRIYPGPGQRRKLEETLESCRWLYNFFLAERKFAWEGDNYVPSCYVQQRELTNLKIAKPTLLNVHSQILCEVAARLDKAFKSFFRRIKAYETPGYPRFKKFSQYKSFTYPQIGSNGTALRIVNNKINLPKIGLIKIKLHRPLEGKPKTCTVHKSPTGKWWVTFACEVIDPVKPSENGLNVGLDLGLKTFAQLSDGSKIENPRFFKKEQKELARVQRKLNKKVVARVYERISFKRENFCHQESRKLINHYQFIAIEDLSIKKMLEKKKFSKSIADASWTMFSDLLLSKAESAGRAVVKVPAAYTSQDCSSCGSRQKLTLSQRTYECPQCGLVMDRDLNASLNILRLGLQSLGGPNGPPEKFTDNVSGSNHLSLGGFL